MPGFPSQSSAFASHSELLGLWVTNPGEASLNFGAPSKKKNRTEIHDSAAGFMHSMVKVSQPDSKLDEGRETCLSCISRGQCQAHSRYSINAC